MGLALFGSALFLAMETGCSYRSRVASAFALMENDFFQTAGRGLSGDPRFRGVADGVREEIGKRFPEQAIILAKVYAPNGKLPQMFVENHLPSKRCGDMLAALKGAERDGIEPSAFGYETLSRQVSDLGTAPPPLPPVTIDPDERNAMITAIAEEGNGLPLDSDALFKWLADPVHRVKYPRFEAEYEKLWQTFAARLQSELRLEFTCAAQYFRFLTEMGLPPERLEEAWKNSFSAMAKVVESLAPQDARYLRLRDELARYRRLEVQCPEPPRLRVPEGGKMKMGAAGGDVASLQERLATEAYYSGEANGVFDEETRKAVRTFQRTHQVGDDGVVGKDTIESLNVPFQRRVDQIRLALEKYRKSKTRRESYFVRVNIPEFVVELVDQGRVQQTHKVVVGNLQEENHTPELESSIEKIVYNPSWYITKRIFEKEEVPHYVKDKEYFKKKGYVVKWSNSGRPVAAYEPPGPGNALGKVKILFPNKYDVYMHDTPQKHLFPTTVRTYSHGCIRLQNPLEFVDYILRRENNKVLPKVPKILEGKDTFWVTLKNKVPIYLEYCTVSTTPEGRAVFLRDVYKRDQEILAGMREKHEKIEAAP